jgi:hypothetical protein
MCRGHAPSSSLNPCRTDGNKRPVAISQANQCTMMNISAVSLRPTGTPLGRITCLNLPHLHRSLGSSRPPADGSTWPFHSIVMAAIITGLVFLPPSRSSKTVPPFSQRLSRTWLAGATTTTTITSSTGSRRELDPSIIIRNNKNPIHR